MEEIESTFSITDASSALVLEIQELQAASMRVDGRMGIYDAMPLELLARRVNDRQVPFLVARSGDELLGYAFGLLSDKGCLVDQIAVASEHRGRGAAPALLKQLEAHVEGTSPCLFAEIISDNERSKRFFAKHGFVREEVLPGPSPELSWEIWVKPLSASMQSVDRTPPSVWQSEETHLMGEKEPSFV